MQLHSFTVVCELPLQGNSYIGIIIVYIMIYSCYASGGLYVTL